ncbi:PP2C family serine/threonine-protein phosphatase [Arcobacter sp. LA11]|uniref:PP2C family protein-serine/threonine phosphatase n=1 Tax=Arcobacter sp. LA11 TaxID=1898176 RepID=UPI000934D139|nr:PP2C family serine/threonine-protein phosphatase [Arcobacter sp. LA11]
MIYKSFTFTHPGHIRKVNEDSFYASDERGLWIVCDGMGGHAEGNFASHLVTDIFEEMQMSGDFENKIFIMNKQIEKIHAILKNKVEKLGENITIGTTIILLFIEGEKGVCIHSGDSRCYNLRDNILSTVTKDHSVEINDLYGYRKVLTSAISAPGNLFVETTRFIAKKNDAFLLCSDGLYDNVSSKIIKSALEDETLEKGMERLRLSVLSTKADDNITAILVGNK